MRSSLRVPGLNQYGKYGLLSYHVQPNGSFPSPKVFAVFEKLSFRKLYSRPSFCSCSSEYLCLCSSFSSIFIFCSSLLMHYNVRISYKKVRICDDKLFERTKCISLAFPQKSASGRGCVVGKRERFGGTEQKREVSCVSRKKNAIQSISLGQSMRNEIGKQRYRDDSSSSSSSGGESLNIRGSS